MGIFDNGIYDRGGAVSIPDYVQDDDGNRTYATIGQKAAVSMINASWYTGEQAANAFDDLVDQGIAEIEAVAENNDLGVGTATFSVDEPAIDLPTSVNVDDVLSKFDAKQLEIIDLLKTEFDAFKLKFFANDGPFDGAATWLDDSIANASGLPDALAEQIMADAKSSIYADAVVQSDAVLAMFATRRFPLPPGAAASAVLQINQKAQEAVADSARKLMLAAIENAKFSVSKAMELRKLAMDSTAEYVRSIVAGNTSTTQMLNTGYDAQSKLISAAASFYNARIDAAKARAQVEQFNVSKDYEKDVKNLDVDIESVSEKVKILMVEAQALAQIATSLFNNVNVSANVSANA